MTVEMQVTLKDILEDIKAYASEPDTNAVHYRV